MKCNHSRYGKSPHCGEMLCDNYINKCPAHQLPYYGSKRAVRCTATDTTYEWMISSEPVYAIRVNQGAIIVFEYAVDHRGHGEEATVVARAIMLTIDEAGSILFNGEYVNVGGDYPAYLGLFDTTAEASAYQVVGIR